MVTKTTFIPWKSAAGGHSLGGDIALAFEKAQRAQIYRWLEHQQGKSVEQLVRGGILEKIKGLGALVFYELKKRGRMSVRFIAHRVASDQVLLLVVFKGSGSDGRVEKYIPLAQTRLTEWHTNNITNPT